EPAYTDNDFDEEDEPPRRSVWPALVTLALLLALLVGAAWAGYGWSQRQYYVGSDGTHVVIYRGVAQDLGPISLSTPVETTQVELDALPPVTRQQVEATITASDLAYAEGIVARLEADAQPAPAVPSPMPSDGGGASDAGGAGDAGGASP